MSGTYVEKLNPSQTCEDRMESEGMWCCASSSQSALGKPPTYSRYLGAWPGMEGQSLVFTLLLWFRAASSLAF